MISWRNPTRKHADWNLDTYAERVRRAIGVARAITGSPDVNTMGFCAGGIITTTLLNHLASTSDTQRAQRVVRGDAARLRVHRAPIGAFSGTPHARAGATRVEGPRRCSRPRALGSLFSWMRPDDLVFNYLVNQWLMGEAPPAFDVLAWNADGTNLPAALHEQFLDIFRDNSLVRPGATDRAGDAGGPRQHHRADVRDRCRDRPHHAVDRLLPDDAADVGAVDLRAQPQRPHPEPGQPAGQPEGVALDGRPRRAARPS